MTEKAYHCVYVAYGEIQGYPCALAAAGEYKADQWKRRLNDEWDLVFF